MSQPVKAEAALGFTSIEIKSDGTVSGTTILLNGKPIKDLSSLRVGFFPDPYGFVSLEFATRDPESQPGTLAESSYFTLIPPVEGAQASLKKGETVPVDMVRDRRDRVSAYARMFPTK